MTCSSVPIRSWLTHCIGFETSGLVACGAHCVCTFTIWTPGQHIIVRIEWIRSPQKLVAGSMPVTFFTNYFVEFHFAIHFSSVTFFLHGVCSGKRQWTGTVFAPRKEQQNGRHLLDSKPTGLNFFYYQYFFHCAPCVRYFSFSHRSNNN